MKTIRQIAVETGVTKQAIFKKIKAPPLSTNIEPFMSKVDGVLMVEVDGVKLIKQAFKKKEPPTESSKDMAIHLQVALQFAERENEFLRAENARLQEQNSHLTAAIIAATARRAWRLRLPWSKRGD